MATPSSTQSVARLTTFLLILLIVSWLYPSAKLFTYWTSELFDLGFSLKTWLFFVALIDSIVLIFHAFLDDYDHLTSVVGACYLSLPSFTVWSKRHILLRGECKRHNAVLAFFNKFRFWRTAHPHSPDLNHSTSIFGWFRKIRFSMNNLTLLTLYNVWKVLPKDTAKR